MKIEQLCQVCSLTGQTLTPSRESLAARLPSVHACMVKMESELYVCTQHVSTFHTHTLVWVRWVAEASEAPTLGSWVTHPLSVLHSVPLSHAWNKTPDTMHHALSRICAWNQMWCHLHLRATLFHNYTIEQWGVCLHWRLLVNVCFSLWTLRVALYPSAAGASCVVWTCNLKYTKNTVRNLQLNKFKFNLQLYRKFDGVIANRSIPN